MPVAVPATRSRVEPMRLHQKKLILRAGHRDVEQAPLFFDLFFASRGHVRGNAAVYDIQDVDDVPLLALRRVDRRKDQVVLVDERIGGEIAERFGWIEREVAEKTLSARVGLG